MDDPKHAQNPHSHFAARKPAGAGYPTTLKKDGVRHQQRLPDGTEREIIACGLACSECFSGKNLHRILLPGFEKQHEIMEALARGEPAAPLIIHTSSGVPEALPEFLDALALHLPWKNKDELDWCVSLQLEGASAVWAAIDMVLQVNIIENKQQGRLKIAVGATSYHGPPSTSFGANQPLWAKNNQLIYPVPTAYGEYDEEELLEKYRKFLDDNAHEIGVMLFEPQWGSSQAALPWPKHLLKTYVEMARERGIKIVCDEIMCGLGRHGMGTLFVSEAWDLDPDAVTFGKAIATGTYPLSGAILKRGRDLLHANKCSVMQSHTYAGSSTLAIMAATEVLKEFVTWLPSIAKLGDEMAHIVNYLASISEGMVVCQGQGLMWGGLFTHNGQSADPAFRNKVVQAFKRHCDDCLIVPYHVPVGGFMISPVIDIDVGTIYDIGERLEEAIKRTMAEVGWEPVIEVVPTPLTPKAIASKSTLDLTGLAEMAGKGFPRVVARTPSTVDLAEAAKKAVSRGSLHLMQDLGNGKCVPYLHMTRCCTECGSFVCRDIRMKFRSNSTVSIQEDKHMYGGETKVPESDSSTTSSEIPGF